MGKKFWIIIALLITGFVGYVWYHGGDTTTSEALSGSGAIVKHVTGKQDATVTLVEYSDFQCSACRAYYPVVEQVIEKYKDKISFEYRHYPLTTIHRNAFAAARASEAADKQGKFWEMYRLLFENQLSWAESGTAQSTFETYAKQLDLDVERYKIDFASNETNSAISTSIKEFNSQNLPQSTPTFLLNGKKITPGNTLEEFSKLIDEQLELSDR